MDKVEKYLEKYLGEGKMMKEVTVELILSVNPNMGKKSEFRNALKNLLGSRGESVMSLKAIKSIEGLV